MLEQNEFIYNSKLLNIWRYEQNIQNTILFLNT